MEHIFWESIKIGILVNPNKLSSLDYITKEAFKDESPSLGWNNPRNPHTLNLPNLDATQLDIVYGGAGDHGPDVFIAKDNYMIEIEDHGGRTEKESLFNQILSTFKFTQ